MEPNERFCFEFGMMKVSSSGVIEFWSCFVFGGFYGDLGKLGSLVLIELWRN